VAINWAQVGEDFEQKYGGCFCRYLSPLNKQKEIYSITDVESHASSPPGITLYNEKNGEIFLNYTTEADLDFTFPPISNFQYKDKALRLEKAYQRQWRKGICATTLKVQFPYSGLYPAWTYHVNEDTLKHAFMPFTPMKISDAVALLDNEEKFSIALSPTLSLGLSHKAGRHWLWYEDMAIGEVTKGQVLVHNPLYIQEVSDFVRDTNDVRTRQA
jgi:hypothetical protein